MAMIWTRPPRGTQVLREVDRFDVRITETGQIVKIIKDLKLKVQAAIQDNQVRVTGKKIDDLQTVMGVLREADLDVPLQFVNMKS